MKIKCECGITHDLIVGSICRRIICLCGKNLIKDYMRAKKEGQTLVTLHTRLRVHPTTQEIL